MGRVFAHDRIDFIYPTPRLGEDSGLSGRSLPFSPSSARTGGRPWASIFRGCGVEWRRCSAGSARSHVGTRARQPTDFLRKWPYSNSSTNSTHLNSTSAAFFSILLYSGMVIFQGRVKTSESSITASYIK